MTHAASSSAMNNLVPTDVPTVSFTPAVDSDSDQPPLIHIHGDSTHEHLLQAVPNDSSATIAVDPLDETQHQVPPCRQHTADHSNATHLAPPLAAFPPGSLATSPSLAPSGSTSPTRAPRSRLLSRTSISSLNSLHAQRARLAKLWHSVDTEEIDNSFVRDYFAGFQHRAAAVKWAAFMPTLAQFLLAAIIGVSCGLFYWGLHNFSNVIHTWRFKIVREHLDSVGNLWGVLFAWSLAWSFVGLALTLWEPAGAGSGMPEIIAYLNGLERPSYMTWRTMVSKAIGMFAMTNSGLFSGYDGPLIHVCAIFAMVLVRNAKKVPFMAKWLFNDQRSTDPGVQALVRIARTNALRLFTTIGASAGLASAFQAPLAGVSFAVEETISFFDPSLTFKSLFACCMALVAYSLASFGKKKNGADYSIYAINTYCNVTLGPWDYLSYVILGILGGVCGHYYNVIVARIRIGRTKLFQRTATAKIFEVFTLVFVTSLVTALSFYGPNFESMTSPSCTPLERVISHITKIPPSEQCSRPCSEWAADANDALVIACDNYLNQGICAENDVLNAIGSVRFNRVSLSLALTDNSTPNKQYIRTRKAQVVRTCARDDPTPIPLLPVDTDLGNLFSVSGVKLQLPQFLYLSPNASSATSSTPNGKDRPDLAPSDSPSSDCYYQMPSLVLNQPEQQIINLFSRGYFYMFRADVLAYFTGMYLVLSLATHHVSMPTDMVIPTLVIGASFGRLFGVGINHMHRRLNTGAFIVDPGAMALLGMSAFWAGTSRLTLTVVILAMQSTGDLTYISGVTIIVLIATFIGNMLGPSMFHFEIEALRLPYLPHEAPAPFKVMTVANLMSMLPGIRSRRLHVVELCRSFTVKAAVDLLDPRMHGGFVQAENVDGDGEDEGHLGTAVHNGYPVVDTNGRLLGLILRSQIRRILAFHAPDVASDVVEWDRKRKRVSWMRQGKRTQHGDAVDDIPLFEMPPGSLDHNANATDMVDPSILDFSLMQDVENQMNRSPCTVHPETSASKAYTLFRSLGLRHLIVVSKTNKVVGILTRTDFSHVIEQLHHHRSPQEWLPYVSHGFRPPSSTSPPPPSTLATAPETQVSVQPPPPNPGATMQHNSSKSASRKLTDNMRFATMPLLPTPGSSNTPPFHLIPHSLTDATVTLPLPSTSALSASRRRPLLSSRTFSDSHFHFGATAPSRTRTPPPFIAVPRAHHGSATPGTDSPRSRSSGGQTRRSAAAAGGNVPDTSIRRRVLARSRASTTPNSLVRTRPGTGAVNLTRRRGSSPEASQEVQARPDDAIAPATLLFTDRAALVASPEMDVLPTIPDASPNMDEGELAHDHDEPVQGGEGAMAAPMRPRRDRGGTM
ncbi:chloride channel [Catenaria anguillulae PL171]|uniref:Chloride channel protein n=1 Tax=Catenaria anguillulae PL171 TaxID=765915 RepID=A0A1Y2H8Q3_9FUNG|nr:chloride channel [Catenaria anguillulae PL171]